MNKHATNPNFLFKNIKHILILATLLVIIFVNSSFAQIVANDFWRIQPEDGYYEDFGHSVDISGNYAIVGARGKLGDGSGHNPAIYFFKRDGDNWIETQKIKGGSYNGFGWHVAISGSYAIVGSLSNEETYIYERQNEEWVEKTRLAKTYNGADVDIFGDYACIGKPDGVGSSNGEVYIYKRVAGSWIQQSTITASDHYNGDGFGHSVSLKGDKLIVGVKRYLGSENRAVYIFYKDGESWYQEAKLIPHEGPNQDDFGVSVDISGDYAIIGAIDDVNIGNPVNIGAVYFFKNENGIWEQDVILQASDGIAGNYFGYSVILEGNTAFVGAPMSGFTTETLGAVYMFKHEDTGWIESYKVIQPDSWIFEHYGYSVAASNGYLIVGNPGGGTGYGYIYQYTDEVLPHHFHFRESDYSQQIFACEESTYHFGAKDENDQIEVNFSGWVDLTVVDVNNNIRWSGSAYFLNGIGVSTFAFGPSGENLTIHLNYNDGTVTGICPYQFDVLPYWIIDFRDDTTLDYNMEGPITVNISECGDDQSFLEGGFIEFSAKLPDTDQEIGSFSPSDQSASITNGAATILYTPPSETEMGSNNNILFKAIYTGPNRVWVYEKTFQLSVGGNNGGGIENPTSYGSPGTEDFSSIVVDDENDLESDNLYNTPGTNNLHNSLKTGNLYNVSTCGSDLNIDGNNINFPGDGGILVGKRTVQELATTEYNIIASRTFKTKAIKTDLIKDYENSHGIGVLFESGGEIEIDSNVVTRTGQSVGFVRYDSNLNVIWETVSDKTQTSLSDRHYATDMATDNTGGITITGYFHEEIVFYGPNQTEGWTGVSPTDTNTEDLFIVKYASNGEVVWGYTASSNVDNNTVKGMAVTVDENGNSYIAGYYSGGVTFGSTTFDNWGAFILKLDALGNLIWVRDIDGGNINIGTSVFIKGIDCDENGGLYLTGTADAYANFSGLVWDGWGNSSITYTNMFITKYNIDGDPLWVNFVTTPMSSSIMGQLNDIAVDDNSNVYVIGDYWGIGPIIFENIELSPLYTENNRVIFVASYDKDGNALWAEIGADDPVSVGTSDFDFGTGITVDASGTCYATGTFSGNTTFGEETLISNGSSDIFLCKISGTVTSINNEYINSITPNMLELSQNYPNPFNPTTIIKYSIPSVQTGFMSSVQLKIYDILGREIAELVNKQQTPGNYNVEFDGSGQSSGIYFYQLTVGNFKSTKKMFLLQ